MGLDLRKNGLSVTLPALVILFLLTGCGGGSSGSSSGMGNSSLSGNYRAGVIGVDATSSWTDLVDINFDGSGQFSGTSAGAGAITGTYSVQSDGVFAADNETGQVSQDGALFHLVDTTTSDSTMSIGIMEGSGMSAADLNGTYHVFFIRPVSGYDLMAERYSFVFDGAGNFTYTPFSAAAPPGATTYSVSGSGTLLTGYADEGQVSANGDIFFFITGSYLAIGIRQTTGMSTADVTGTFHTISLSDNDATDNIVDTISAWRANFIADSTGNVAISFLDPTSPDDSGTITVNTNGAATTSGPVLGQISPDTGFFVMVDDDTLDMSNDYEMLIGILKP